MIWVPHGTSMWQVRDSKQQNGQYKDNIKDAKEKLITMKTKQGMKFAIGKPANIETYRHAIAERGWGALNYVLLDHPELKAINDHVDMVNLTDNGDRYFPQESLHNLNTTKGFAGEKVDLFLEDRAK
jgi:ribosomal protein L29